MKEFFIALLMGTIERLEQTALVAIFQKVHDTESKEEYLLTLYSAKFLTRSLSKFTSATKTKLDDVLVAEIGKAADASAAANGVILEGQTIAFKIVPTNDPQ